MYRAKLEYLEGWEGVNQNKNLPMGGEYGCFLEPHIIYLKERELVQFLSHNLSVSFIYEMFSHPHAASSQLFSKLKFCL